MPMIAPEAMLVASPSFAVDLNRSGDGAVGIVDMAPVSLHGFALDGVDDVLRDDDEDDNVEPDMIADESGKDIVGSNPVGEHVGFGARGTQQGGGEGTEFQVGQQFQDKEEAVLSLKTYSIQRGVQYKVVESDYRKYYGKFNEFGNGCTWCIRISLRQRKGIWEVKRYNGPHTCLATLISSDHRSLDYHVISAFIMPMVRADAAVCGRASG
ncbi:hypothetical protein Ahy_B01g053652 isoform C [Arachis hypogaea]|uniref:Transposase MuDR plant domain-containing protein n=1 Tax=Arachis hypogaea TaxID=3818 RepID=A0A445AS81_ARAHY|nr:hypothetical protein Ahy_B01g053652 isoform C [Arachis hypogaea]